MEFTDTIPKLLRSNYQKYGDKKVAMRKKDLGIWKEYTWKYCYEQVKFISLGLVSLGLKSGDKVAIIGENEPQWYIADWAAQSIGAVTAGLFVDSIPKEVMYILEHSEAKFVFADDQEQVDKVISLKDNLPQLYKVIYWDSKGMWQYDYPFLMSWEELRELGEKYEETHPELFEDLANKVQPEQLAFFSYTSGTTGSLPKGAMHSHRSAITAARLQVKVTPANEETNYFSHIPPAVVRITGAIGHSLVAEGILNYPEGAQTVAADIRELGPWSVIYGPRLWESQVSELRSKMFDAGIIQRLAYNLFLPVGYRVSDFLYADKDVPLFWKALYFVADILLFRAIRDKFGILKSRFVASGGGALSMECLRFYWAIGVRFINQYGSTEMTVITASKPEELISHSVGQPPLGNEVRINNDSSILARSPGCFLGYYKDPEKTRKTFIDGWLHTGDAGYLDQQGYLIYWDRTAALETLADGSKFAPEHIEGMLRFNPYIRDCMVFGGKQGKYVAALISINFDLCGRWAEKNHLAYTTFLDLSQKPEIINLISKELKRLNRDLPEGIRLKKFVSLHKEFDADEAELTRTRKLRRSYVAELYNDLIEAIYSDKEEYPVEATVTYSDGKTVNMKSTIKINNVDSAEYVNNK